jgi:hypothetical protein
MVNEKLCTVCGYEMEEGPRHYNICPSCGTEFGLHDVNSTIDNLRKAWIEGGARWYSTAVPQPQGWKPAVQLARLLFSGDYVATEQRGEVKIPNSPQIVADFAGYFKPLETAA